MGQHRQSRFRLIFLCVQGGQTQHRIEGHRGHFSFLAYSQCLQKQPFGIGWIFAGQQDIAQIVEGLARSPCRRFPARWQCFPEKNIALQPRSPTLAHQAQAIESDCNVVAILYSPAERHPFSK